MNGPDDYLVAMDDEAFGLLLDGARPASAIALADAEAAIEVVAKADKAAKTGEMKNAIEVLSQIDGRLEREALAARLADAVRGLHRKQEVIARVVWRFKERQQDEAALSDEMKRAALGVVDGSELVVEIVKFLKRYMVLDECYFLPLTTWVLLTHLFEKFDFSPYVVVVSPTKRCGKTNLLSLLSLLSARAWKVVSPSVAALFRKLDKDRTPLFLDEIDTAFKGPKEYSEALRGILNAGFEVKAVIPRCIGEGTNLDVKDFRVGGPKALAAIKALPDTITDRSIPVHLKRKTKQEDVERFRTRKVHPQATELKKRIEAWTAGAAAADIERDEPSPIEELGDRQWDVTEPLVVIAHRIGPDCEARLRDDLKQVFQITDEEDGDIGVRLLSDIRDVLSSEEYKRADKIRSTDLVRALKALESSPWMDWREGKGLSTAGLAHFLRSFGISPNTKRSGDTTFKGYYKAEFKSLWERYLTPLEACVSSPKGDSKPSQPSQVNKDAGESPFCESSQDPSVTTQKSASSPHKQRGVTGVTATPPLWEEGDIPDNEDDFEEGKL